MPDKYSYQQTLIMRKTYLGKSCKLHYAAAPIKMVRASKQYMYDECGVEYLDCINNVSHVGHCHPQVVAAGQEQMGKLTTNVGFLSDVQGLYAKRLIETLPERLCVCYFLNSGSEANDLALRLAQDYTENTDLVIVSDAFHGNLGNLVDISPVRWKSQSAQKEHVHVIPCPNLYRGRHKEDSPHAIENYINDAHKIIKNARSNGRKIGAFICDPLMTSSGLITPQPNYLKSIYRYIREAGGVCISDEVQVGLGRVGEHFWAFQSHEVVPDILTCGKPMGNGHPISVVVTTKEIADKFGDFSSSVGGNPVACAIGLAVLDVIKNEQLMSSAKCVGRNLVEGFRNIQDRHPMMGHVRGHGMVIAVEIVTSKKSREPAKEAAELLAYKMKEDKILIANDGPNKNIMFMLPPMCLTCENARRIIQSFDKCLAEIENGLCPEDLPQGPRMIETTQITIPANVLTSSGTMEEADGDDAPLSKRPRHNYDDVD